MASLPDFHVYKQGAAGFDVGDILYPLHMCPT